MLERAPTCLETGGRQLLQRPRPCLRSRRRLHASFWHHAASDLALPSWWATTPLPDGAAGDHDGGDAGGLASKGNDGLLLDFLYPRETLALLRRIAAPRPDAADGRQRYARAAAGGIRRFSTTKWSPREAALGLVDLVDPLELQAQKAFEATTQSASPHDALVELLESEARDRQPLARRLFSAIPEQDRSPKLRSQFLRYLAADPRSNPNLLLRLFDDLPPENRLSHSYEAAISAHLALEMLEPAVQLHDEATSRGFRVRKATATLLRRMARDNQWELALRVVHGFVSGLGLEHQAPDYYEKEWYQKPHRRLPPGRDSANPRAFSNARIWHEVSNLRYLRGHLKSFFLHFEEFRDDILASPGSETSLRHFTYGLCVETMEQVLPNENLSRDEVRKFLVEDVFGNLDRLGLPTYDLYEYAILAMLKIDRFRAFVNKFPLHLELYQMHRKACVADTATSRGPSRKVLVELIEQFGRHDGTRVIERLLRDFEEFHRQHEFLPGNLLKFLTQYYADAGKTDKVHLYFDQYSKKNRGEVDIVMANQLVFAHARRADVRGAEEQFQRITSDLGLKPIVSTWNMLLLSYVRADDLDGSLACFNRILDSELDPDIHTFGPLLDMCAKRGDIEAFEILYQKANQMGISIKGSVRARAGYVLASLNMDDPEGAEATAKAMLQDQRNGKLEGDLTHTWNLLIGYHALRGDVRTSRRLYRDMIDNKIPLDTWTYASLMRALIEVKQTNAAYKILRTTMRQNNVRIHAFHYAQIVTGFLRERQVGQANRAAREMAVLQIPQTNDSRMAHLEVLGMRELEKLREQKDTDVRTRLFAMERYLRRVLETDYMSEVAHRQPRHSRTIDYRTSSPEGYFGLLIMLYGKRSAFDICKELFETVSASQREQNDEWIAPISLLTMVMEAHCRAGEHEDVAKCWEMVLAQSQDLVKTFHTVMNPEKPQVQSDSILDPALKKSFESAKIATTRRQVVTRAARIYMRSLLAQETGLQQAQRTIRSLLTNGFIVDNLTWNEFIQMLARRGRILDAFSACEAYLMPAFPGWRSLSPFYIRKNLPGLTWMDIRHDEVDRNTLMPRYKTLVVLAAAYAQVRRDEREGLGFVPEMGAWTRELLERLSPDTLRAVETMPRTGDQLQRRFLGEMFA